MTRDEAKKKAEAYATEYATDAHGEPHIKTDENGEEYGSDEANPEWRECYDDCVRAYMACYDMLVSGEPDGWVRDREWKGQLIKGKELFDSPQKARAGFSEEFCTMEENGYRIVPVKLIRVEG